MKNFQHNRQLKTFVINLKRRTDRKERFIKRNDCCFSKGKVPIYKWYEGVDGQELTYDKLLSMGFDTDKHWIDDDEAKYIYYSSKGDIGARVSHMQLWEKCIELNEPIFILEDDARILPSFNVKELYELLDLGYNLIYPGYAEQRRTEVIKKGKYQIPVYPYWASSYIIAPDSAKVFLEYKKKLIPIDELITKCCNDIRIKPIGRIENSIDQGIAAREIPTVLDSDIDVFQSRRGVYDMFIDFKVHTITPDDNLIDAINTYPDHDLIFYLGKNTILADCINQIMYRYIRYNTRVLVCADKECHTNLNELFLIKDRKDMFSEKRNTNMNSAYKTYKYINPNLWIGRVSELKKMFSKNSIQDPHLFFDVSYLSGKYDIKIDRECKVFCAESTPTNTHTNLSKYVDKSFNVNSKVEGFHVPSLLQSGYSICIKNRELYNAFTRTQPCAYYNDNDDVRKELIDELKQ